jgi:uncharacterized protein YeaO (DUF488 family)
VRALRGVPGSDRASALAQWTSVSKRAYEPAAASDGYRILIDRIWPRGVTREEGHLDEWVRETRAELRAAPLVWA